MHFGSYLFSHASLAKPYMRYSLPSPARVFPGSSVVHLLTRRADSIPPTMLNIPRTRGRYGVSFDYHVQMQKISGHVAQISQVSLLRLSLAHCWWFLCRYYCYKIISIFHTFTLAPERQSEFGWWTLFRATIRASTWLISSRPLRDVTH